MKNLIRGIILVLILSATTGIVYPFTVTILGQLFFHDQANGSLLKKDTVIVGSRLIGQNFSSNKYFWPRPSYTNYNTLPSGGSNLSPVSTVLKDSVIQRTTRFQSTNNISNSSVPGDMIFSSGSGLDPHISVTSAILQIDRVCKARNYTDNLRNKVHDLVYHLSQGPQLMIFGDQRVNVLLLNNALDSIEANQ